MSRTLFIKDIKSHYKLLLAFMALLTMYFLIIIGMYDPKDSDIMARLAGMKMSPELLAAFGFSTAAPGLNGFMSTYLYGFLMLGLPMAYAAILGNKLVAALVDKGSMAAILSSPLTRRKAALTQAAFLLGTLTLLLAFAALAGIAFSALRFPGQMDIGVFIRMNLGLLLMQAAISGICFFASCLFNLSGSSLTLGAGLPVVFLLAQLLVNASPKLSGLKYFTLFSLYRAAGIAAGESQLPEMLILLALALLLYAGGVLVFDRKDLPI